MPLSREESGRGRVYYYRDKRLLFFDPLVRALCPGTLRAGLRRAAWRTALCAWRWRKAGSFCRALSFVSQKENSKNCVWVVGSPG